MTHLALVPDWAAPLVLATPEQSADRAGLNRLPSEWTTVDGVVLDDHVLDHVVVGPNGVFAVAVDPDPEPAAVGDDGLYRQGTRVTTTVKSAVMAATALRQRVGERMFAYPLLVTAIDGAAGYLARLGVVPPGGIPETIWSHPGRPLTRSQRLETLWTLRSLASA
jgi:hypothetical protein